MRCHVTKGAWGRRDGRRETVDSEKPAGRAVGILHRGTGVTSGASGETDRRLNSKQARRILKRRRPTDGLIFAVGENLGKEGRDGRLVAPRKGGADGQHAWCQFSAHSHMPP